MQLCLVQNTEFRSSVKRLSQFINDCLHSNAYFFFVITVARPKALPLLAPGKASLLCFIFKHCLFLWTRTVPCCWTTLFWSSNAAIKESCNSSVLDGSQCESDTAGPSYDGYCYFKHKNELNFFDAKDKCESKDAQLPAITHRAEHAFAAYATWVNINLEILDGGLWFDRLAFCNDVSVFMTLE